MVSMVTEQGGGESESGTFGYSLMNHPHSSCLHPHLTMATELSISPCSHRSSKPKNIQKAATRHEQDRCKPGRGGRSDGCGVRGGRVGGGPRHSSRLRSASRESTSARGALQKAKEENSDRKSCRDRRRAGSDEAAQAV